MKTVFFPPIVNYNILYQRPQQILRALSRAGNETFFMNSESGREGEYICNSIIEEERNFYIVPLGREPNKKFDFLYLTYPSFLKTWAKLTQHHNLWFDSIDLPEDEFGHWSIDFYESIEQADFVTASSEVLFDIVKEINPNADIVRNGVEYNLFQQKTENPYKEFDKPIVGFGGAIATWVDLELIYECADIYPEYMFVILGINFNTQLIKEHKMPENLKFLGHKNYFDLPAYYQHMDACTIPFKDTNMTQAANPIKFWEYMATGNPVVTSNLIETKYKGVHWSKDNDEYIDNIEKAVEEKLNGNKGEKTRKKIAKSGDWDERVKLIINLMEEI